MKRIKNKFTELKQQNKTAFVGYICAGDPNIELSSEVLQIMPKAGIDIIELGVPFLDPAGDGPVIEEAAKRAISSGVNFKKVLQMVENFRKNDENTPIILMGYFNSFLKYGLDKIFLDAQNVGADGVLIVDLPLEERQEVHGEIKKTNLDFINLISPLSDEKRIMEIADEEMASGFLYNISMLGITGTKSAEIQDNIKSLEKIRKVTNLETVIGFGIKTPEQAGKFAKIGFDGVVIGSTIVKEIYQEFKKGNKNEEIVNNISNLIKNFSEEIKG